jgi:acetate kinase
VKLERPSAIKESNQPFLPRRVSDNSAGFVLILNAGSSSLKFGLFGGGSALVRVLSGAIDRIGSSAATFVLKETASQQVDRTEISAPNHLSCLDYLLQRLSKTTVSPSFRAVGHRVVHGGPRYTQPQIVTAEMTAILRQFRPFAPEHLPGEIDLIEGLSARFPNLPQVACFDTAFHRDLPRVAYLLPIPRRYEAAGVRRYGFHGLSYEFLMDELARLEGFAAAKRRIILAHLGNGASLAAVRDGRCVDTSMGFTPAAGLVMGRRSGDLDPGLVSYLAESEGLTAQGFHELVNHESGLLGVSGISSDMRELLALESKDSRAAEAIALFCYQAKKWIGSFAAALGGLDTLVFAGGIGENNPRIRNRICEGLGFLGIGMNETHNAENAGVISSEGGRVIVRVIRTDEELMIARSVCRVLGIS